MSVFLKTIPIFLILLSLNIEAASYDCSLKTLNKVESMICDNKGLSNKDELLHDLYVLLPKKLEFSQFQILFPDLKNNQRSWLSSRNSCVTEECLISLFDSRIKDLRKKLLWAKQKTSKHFVLDLIDYAYADSIAKRKVEEIVFHSLVEGEHAEYLVRSRHSMGLNSNYCGSGSVVSYIYLRYDFESGQIDNKKRLTSHDCGNSHNLLTHKVEMNSDGGIKIVTFFDYLSSGVPKEAFRISVGNIFIDRKHYVIEKEIYPKEPWG